MRSSEAVTHSRPVHVVLAALAATLLGSGSSEPSFRSHLLGRSVDGRPIVALEVGDLDATRRVLVVGCIHGNEPAGIAVVAQLARARARGLDLWLVPDLNPDGLARQARGNAHGVDLNRNFPLDWQHLHGLFYSGPRPLSEPESRIAYRLILRLRPQISIWFHQHLGLVDLSGGDPAVERRFARAARLPLRRLVRYPGSAVGWQDTVLPKTTAFVVELPPGRLTVRGSRRYATAVLVTARQ
jgi:protein MpaA